MRWSERSRLHKKLIVLNGTSVSNPSSELKELCGRKGRKTAKTKDSKETRPCGPSRTDDGRTAAAAAGPAWVCTRRDFSRQKRTQAPVATPEAIST